MKIFLLRNFLRLAYAFGALTLRAKVGYSIAMFRYEEWLDQRSQARALFHIIHKSKTEWIFSGTIRNENGVVQDAGFLRSPYPMRRAQALKYFAKAFPRANMIHVDDKNKIITYSF